MGELAEFEVDQHETLEDEIVKNQIDIEFIFVEADKLLAGDKRKALSEFQQKCLQIVDNGLFEVAFMKTGGIGRSRNSSTIGDLSR